MKQTALTHSGLWRLAIVAGALLALEIACRTGIIDPLTLVPPSRMVVALVNMSRSAPWFWSDIGSTFRNIGVAAAVSIVFGFLIGLIVHALPRLRAVLSPVLLSYYSVPTFVFYPLLIVIFGIRPASLIAMGAMFGIVAMISATLASIDRIPPVYGKVARVARLSPWQTVPIQAARGNAAPDHRNQAGGGVFGHRRNCRGVHPLHRGAGAPPDARLQRVRHGNDVWAHPAYPDRSGDRQYRAATVGGAYL